MSASYHDDDQAGTGKPGHPIGPFSSRVRLGYSGVVRLRCWLLVAVLGSSGCTHPSRPVYVTSAVVGGGGAVSLFLAGVTWGLTGFGASADCDASTQCDDPLHTPKVFGVVGLGLLAVGAIGMMVFGEPAQESAATRDPEVNLDRQNRADALQLTKLAAVAAREGNCAVVVNYHHNVLALDPEIHATVFVKDVGISWCLNKEGIDVSPAPTPSVVRGQALDAELPK